MFNSKGSQQRAVRSALVNNARHAALLVREDGHILMANSHAMVLLDLSDRVNDVGGYNQHIDGQSVHQLLNAKDEIQLERSARYCRVMQTAYDEGKQTLWLYLL